jgi:hypothetical protein
MEKKTIKLDNDFYCGGKVDINLCEQIIDHLINEKQNNIKEQDLENIMIEISIDHNIIPISFNSNGIPIPTQASLKQIIEHINFTLGNVPTIKIVNIVNIVADNGSKWAKCRLGKFYSDQNDPNNMIKYLNELLINNDEDALLILAEYYKKTNDIDNMLKYLDILVAKHNDKAVYLMSDYYYKKKDYNNKMRYDLMHMLFLKNSLDEQIVPEIDPNIFYRSDYSGKLYSGKLYSGKSTKNINIINKICNIMDSYLCDENLYEQLKSLCSIEPSLGEILMKDLLSYNDCKDEIIKFTTILMGTHKVAPNEKEINEQHKKKRRVVLLQRDCEETNIESIYHKSQKRKNEAIYEQSDDLNA